MRFICFICILFSIPAFSQTEAPPPGLSTMEAYRLALRSFLTEHMELTYRISEPPGHIVFLRQKPFTEGFADTIAGVKIRFFDPVVAADMDTMVHYMHKKQKLNILSLEQMILRETQGQIWIMPMKAAFDPKKRLLAEPEFSGSGCEYVFEYILGNQASFKFKQSLCKDF